MYWEQISWEHRHWVNSKMLLAGIFSFSTNPTAVDRGTMGIKWKMLCPELFLNVLLFCGHVD